MAIATNPTTGVEYDDITGNSIKKYVAVEPGGTVRNPSGGPWPYNEGGVHTQPYDYFELAPFESVPYDPELFIVDSQNSGWGLHPARNTQGEFVAVPDGHPKGKYKYTETLRRRSVAELKETAERYCRDFNQAIMNKRPQDAWYQERLTMASEEIAKGNTQDYFVEAVERDSLLAGKLRAACRHNDDWMAYLFDEIDKAGETGVIDFVLSQMATAGPGGQQLSGWVNGIPE
jgi:hypothetical protein